MIVPDAGRYIWEWYFDLSDGLRRVRDGAAEPIPPSEFQAWREATGNIVYPREYAILRAMDREYCAGLNSELSDYNARKEAERAQEADKGRRKGR